MPTTIHLPGIQLEDELGRGAHSIVFRARHGGALCAVKIPRVRGHWTTWVYREAVALARVRHPGLPEVWEVGEEEGLPYLVMELVEGETLAERLGRSPVGDDLTLSVATQVASALAAVHDVGLVHRDVKPRNIVLEPSGRVRLVDFGFATPIERVGEPALGTAGTPAYAAPEQLRSPPSVDGRTDLYGLGRVLTECIAGRLSLVGSERGALESSPLRQVVRGLLEESPHDRYPDARALLTDLERVRQGRPVLGPTGYDSGQRPQPLVGRSAELQRLTQAWANVRLAAGSIVVLTGPRGGGKSRLLAAYTAKMREAGGRCVLEARCRAGDIPLATLRRIFDGYLASLARASALDRATGERALREAAAAHLAPVAAHIAPSLARVLGPLPPTEVAPEGFAEGAAELLIRLARIEGPFAICIDDAHWMDPVSRDVLVRVAHRVDTAPLLLVLVARDEEPIAWLEQVATMDRNRGLAVRLAPQGEDEVAALVAAHLGVARAEPALVRRIAALGDGTPLGALEVLGAFLDSGALRPAAGAWSLDVERMDRVSLPEGAMALLGRRLFDIPTATRRVLEAAAVLGASFPDEALARTIGLEARDLAYGLADGRRAGLIEADGIGRHRFVHDSLRERLDASLETAERRGLHQSAAEALDDDDAPDFDALAATATHYAKGDLAKNPARAYVTARRAATAALDRFDNETALRFLDMADAAGRVGAIVADVGYHRNRGEAHLRQGQLDASLRGFEAALARAGDPRTCATVLGRIAWVHSTCSRPEQAWASLERAFAAIGVAMPVEGAASVTRTLAHFGRSRLRAARPLRAPANIVVLDPEVRAARELLCDLHYQNARLALEQGKPIRMLQSAFEGVAASESLGPSRAEARARAIYALVLTALGRRSAGERELNRARQTASSLGDPITATFCLQLESITACFAGDFDHALVLLRECVEGSGHWLELTEFCNETATAELIESLRGRSSHARAWLALADERRRRNPAGAAMVPLYFLHRAAAAIAASGGTTTTDPWLADAVANAALRVSELRGFSRLLCWGPRARLFVENGDVGPAFEALVAEFETEGHNPRFVHPTLVEYYIAVAHGRLHQCLRSPSSARGPHLAKLQRALRDLRLCAKLPLFKTHLRYIEGCAFLLEGSPEKATAVLAEAAALAIQETCPWVLYGIARVRAHVLCEMGRPDAARDQARIAEAVAEEHGSEQRLRWIREELSLPVAPPPPSVRLAPSTRSSRSSRSSRAGGANPLRQQLAALLHVIRAPVADLRPEQQVRAVLDDVVRAVGAERGLLGFEPDPKTRPPLVIGRTRDHEAHEAYEDWAPTDDWRDAFIAEVRAIGEAWPLASDVADLVDAPSVPHGIDATRVLVVPLFLHDQAVGTLYLERAPATPPFTAEERDLLLVLSYQVPVSIELARLLAERDQVHSSMQQAQKMEAVGQLASSVAHDFANMLVAVRTSLSTIRERALDDPDIAAEVSVIGTATDRAGRLMRQLLGFSQDRLVVRVPISINDAIIDLAPMLERLAGDLVVLKLRLDPDIELVSLERASFEHVLVNLVVNGRDAMPVGGTLTIETRNVILDGAALRRGACRAGEHVVLTVRDTGHGIAAENLPRIFDPFFTTKPVGSGTGIGLTTAYAFVKRSTGHIEVSSEVGAGTTFRLYFPKASDALDEALEGDGEGGALRLPGASSPTVH